jgi:hypothetical protein
MKEASLSSIRSIFSAVSFAALLAACAGRAVTTMPAMRQPASAVRVNAGGSYSASFLVTLYKAPPPTVTSFRVSLQDGGRTRVLNAAFLKTNRNCTTMNVAYLACELTFNNLSSSYATYTITTLGSDGKVTYTQSAPYELQYGPIAFTIDDPHWTHAFVSFDQPLMGKPTRIHVRVAAMTEENSQIIGPLPFDRPLQLNDTDKSGATHFSVASLARPGNPTLDYDGVSYVSPTIWAGPKSNGMTDNPQLTPIVRTREFKIPSDRNVKILFNGRSRILPNSDGTATFLETPVLDRYPTFEAIGRVEKTGQVVETRLPFHAVDIAKGPDGKVWILGSTANRARPSAIYRLNDDGTTTQKYAFWYDQSGPMILGPDGDFWVIADLDHKSIGAERISPDGKVTNFRIGDNQTDLTDLVAGNDGNVWYVGDGSIAPGLSPGSDFVRVSPNGKYSVFRSPQNSQGCGGYLTSPAAGSNGDIYAIAGLQCYAFVGKTGRVTVPQTQLQVFFNVGPLGSGPDAGLWFAGGNSAPVFTSCFTPIGRIDEKGTFANLEIANVCPTDSKQISVTGFYAGSDGSLWYARGSAVGKIDLPKP